MTSAPRIVMVHGAMDRGNSFRQLAKLLAPIEVVIWDRAGYAHSLAVAPADVGDHLRDLMSILDEKPAIVFGHSLGGTYALWLAAIGHPNLRGVATFESPLPGGAWWDSSWEIDPLVAASGLVTPVKAGQVAEGFLRRMMGDSVWERLPERTKALRRAEGMTFVRELGQLVSGRIAFELDTITVELSAGVSSRPSHHHQIGLAELSAQTGARTYCVRNSRHGAHLTNPDALAEVLVQEVGRLG